MLFSYKAYFKATSIGQGSLYLPKASFKSPFFRRQFSSHQMQHLSKHKFLFHQNGFPSLSHFPICPQYPHVIHLWHPLVSLITSNAMPPSQTFHLCLPVKQQPPLRTTQDQHSCPYMRDAGLACLPPSSTDYGRPGCLTPNFGLM